MQGPMPVRLLDLEQVGHSRIGQVVVFRARQRHRPQRIADGQSLASDILAGLQVVELATKGIAGKGRDLEVYARDPGSLLVRVKVSRSADAELLAKPSGLAKRLNDQVQKLLKDSNSPEFVATEAIARLKS